MRSTAVAKAPNALTTLTALGLWGALLALSVAPARGNTLEDIFAVQDTFTFDRPAAEAVMAGDLVLLRAVDGTLSAVRADTGALVWRRAADLGAEMRFRILGDTILLTTAAGLEAVRRDSGMRTWSWVPLCELDRCRSRIVAEGRATLLMETTDGFWHAVAVETGRTLWRVKASAPPGAEIALSPHAVIAATSSWAAGLELTFLDPDNGRELARWRSDKVSGGVAPVWHRTTRGARVLISNPPSPARRAGPPDIAEALIIDSLGKVAERRAVPALSGVGTRVAWSRVTPDEALVAVDGGPGGRAHILRIHERSKGRIEVELASDLGVPFPASSALVLPPSGARATWGILRGGHKLWRAEMAGLSPAARTFAVSDRYALLAHHDGLVEADIALEKVTGVGVLDLDARDPLLAAGWHGRTPVIVQGTKMTLLRRMKLIEVRDKLKHAELRGVDTAPLRARLGRFALLAEHLARFERDEDDFDPGPDEPEAPEAAPKPAAGAQPATDPAAAAQKAAREASEKAMALAADETATLRNLRDAWLGGEIEAVSRAAQTWLERAEVPAKEPQRVAGALGWMFFGVAVAPDRPDGLEWLLGPARWVARFREGLPLGARVAWALVSARAGDGALAAEFLDSEEGGLAASARRVLAVRALKGMRDTGGDLRSRASREMFGQGLKHFAHVDLLFGASAERVRALADRVAEEAAVLSEIDGYMHVIGIKQVSRGPADVEVCALGCQVVADRCGFSGDADPCVRRCLKSGAVRLAGSPRAEAGDDAWYCGF